MPKKQQKFILFYINDEQFAMPLLENSQFIAGDKTTAIPNTNKKVMGLIYNGGNIITVLDTAKFLNIKYKRPDEYSYLLFDYNKDFYGLIVDHGGETKIVNDIFTDKNKKYFKKYIKINKQKAYILEPENVLEELKIYD